MLSLCFVMLCRCVCEGRTGDGSQSRVSEAPRDADFLVEHYPKPECTITGSEFTVVVCCK
jgi:hypothetical protein